MHKVGGAPGGQELEILTIIGEKFFCRVAVRSVGAVTFCFIVWFISIGATGVIAVAGIKLGTVFNMKKNNFSVV